MKRKDNEAIDDIEIAFFVSPVHISVSRVVQNTQYGVDPLFMGGALIFGGDVML